MLSEKYQAEQIELDAKIKQYCESIKAFEQTAIDAEKWIDLIKQYINPSDLTSDLLNTLIEKIVVHEAVKNDGSREQEIEIFYRFIGKVD